MGSRTFFVSALLVLAAPQTAALAGQPAAAPKLEGMAYPKARLIVSRMGWKPVSGNCSGGGTSARICQRYPEVGNCSGTGEGFCDMLFVRNKRCLRMVTVGGPPGGGATVRDVMFGAAPCLKNE